MGSVFLRTRRVLAAAVAVSAVTNPSAAGAHCSANGVEERRALEFRETWNWIKEEQVRSAIAAWYAELQKGPDGRMYTLTTPQPILEHCECLPPDITPAKYALPVFRDELAYSALKFSYEIDALRIDDDFARVEVWERGWYYAGSSKVTYENDADTTFVLERDDDNRWQVLAYTARRSAVHPKHADEPRPDLREEYFKKFPNVKIE